MQATRILIVDGIPDTIPLQDAVLETFTLMELQDAHIVLGLTVHDEVVVWKDHTGALDAKECEVAGIVKELRR